VLPENLAVHVPVRDSILSRPVCEDKLPAFFSELLHQWGRDGLVPVAGPLSQEEIAASAARPLAPGPQPQWVKVAMEHGQTIQEQVVQHPDWGKPAMARQLYSEQRGIDIGVAHYMQQKIGSEKRGVGSALGPVQRLLEMWFGPVTEAIQRWQELFVMSCLRDQSLDDMVASTFHNLSEAHRPAHTCPFGMLESDRWDSQAPTPESLSSLRGQLSSLDEEARARIAMDFKVLGPVLMSIPASKLAVIVMHEVMSSFLAHGGHTSHTNASRRVGRAVQAEWGMDALKGTRNRFQVSMKEVGQAAKARDVRKLNMLLARVFRRPNWDDERMLIKVGSLLISFFLDAAKFSPAILERGGAGMLDWDTHRVQADLMPGLEHSFVKERSKSHPHGIIKISPPLHEALERSHAHTANLTPLLLPMVVKPLPWTAFDAGCYLLARTQVMRVVDFGEQERLCRAADMSRIFQALDVLSGTAWSINTKMLYTIQQAWVQDLVIADIPPKDDVELEVGAWFGGWVCLHVCVCVRACVRVRACTHTHTHTHTHTQNNTSGPGKHQHALRRGPDRGRRTQAAVPRSLPQQAAQQGHALPALFTD